MNTILLTGFTRSDLNQLSSGLPEYAICTIRDKDKARSIGALFSSARPGKKIKSPYISWQPMVITAFQSQREQSQFEEKFSKVFNDTAHIITTTGEGGKWTLDRLVKGLEESSWSGSTRTQTSVTCPWCGVTGTPGQICSRCGGPLGDGEKQGQLVFHRIHNAPPYDFMKLTKVAGGFGSMITGLAPLIIGVVFLSVALTAIKGHGSVVNTLKMTFGGIGAVMALVGGILVFRPFWKMFRR